MRDNKQNKKHSNKPLEGGESDFSHIEPVQARPLEVKVYNFDRALKAFRSLVQKERILSTYKEKQRFEKKSDKRRRKRNERKRKLMELEVKSDFSVPRRKKIKEIKNDENS